MLSALTDQGTKGACILYAWNRRDAADHNQTSTARGIALILAKIIHYAPCMGICCLPRRRPVLHATGVVEGMFCPGRWNQTWEVVVCGSGCGGGASNRMAERLMTHERTRAHTGKKYRYVMPNMSSVVARLRREFQGASGVTWLCARRT